MRIFTLFLFVLFASLSAQASNSFRHQFNPSTDYLLHGYDHHSRQVEGLFFHLGYGFLDNPLVIKDTNNSNRLGILIDTSHAMPFGAHYRRDRLAVGLNTQLLFLDMGDAYTGDSSFTGLGDTKLNLTYDLFQREKATLGFGVNASFNSGDKDYFASYDTVAYGAELFYTGVLSSRILYSTVLGFHYAKDAAVGSFDLQKVLALKLAVKYILTEKWSVNFEGVKEWTFPGNNNLNPNEGLLLAQYSKSENLHLWAGAGLSNFFDSDDSRNYSVNLGAKFRFSLGGSGGYHKTQAAPVVAPEPSKVVKPAPVKKIEKVASPEYKSNLVVYFGFNSSSLDVKALADIQKAVDAGLLKNKKLYVGGFTDSRGNPDYNKVLSQRRAKAVQNHLLKLGYKGDLKVLAHGESKLIFESAQNEKEHASNRRVEIFTLSH